MGQAKRGALSGESESTLPPEVRLALKQSMEYPQPCVVCKALTQNRGVYIAGDPNRVAAPKGKTRYVVYPICDGCLEKVKDDPGLLTSVEDQIETRALSIPVSGTNH